MCRERVVKGYGQHNTSMPAYKKMLRVKKLVLDTESFCMTAEPKTDEKDWYLDAYSNSD